MALEVKRNREVKTDVLPPVVEKAVQVHAEDEGRADREALRVSPGRSVLCRGKRYAAGDKVTQDSVGGDRAVDRLVRAGVLSRG